MGALKGMDAGVPLPRHTGSQEKVRREHFKGLLVSFTEVGWGKQLPPGCCCPSPLQLGAFPSNLERQHGP